jgi:hypothetical protein
MMNFDLESIPLEKTLDLQIEGWKPLTIEYATRAFSGISWLFWKVSGTDHVFRIQYQLVIQNHAGDLKDHLNLVLTTFRQDYKEWESTGFEQDWMKKYKRMFQDLII